MSHFTTQIVAIIDCVEEYQKIETNIMRDYVNKI